MYSKFCKEVLKYVGVIQKLSALLNSLIENAQKDVAESLEGFVNDKVRSLGQLTGGYFECLNAFSVKTRGELESKWKELYHNKDVRESVDNLFEMEERWNHFLKSVDEKLDSGMVTSSEPLVVGSIAPLDIPLFNIDTDRYISLIAFIGCFSLLPRLKNPVT